MEIYDDISNQLGISLNDQDRELFGRLLSMPSEDSDTVSDFVLQQSRINREIETLQEQQRVLETQHQTDTGTAEAIDTETAERGLDDDTVSTVRNYVGADNEVGQFSEPSDSKALIRTANGTELEVQYRIVDADSLIASHNEDGDINPNFPQELQPRQRSRIASIMQIDRIANNLDPELLGANRLASDGAPVIGNDGIVESGNGRILAIRQAYKSGKAQRYRQWLIDNAYRFGLLGEEAESLEHPVLVRERLSDVDRETFVREANESTLAVMSSAEQAASDAAALSDNALAIFDPTRSITENTDFIREFARSIQQNELGQFMDKNGVISRAGINRIVAALLAKAFNDPALLDKFTESWDDNMRNISKAIIAAAPSLATFQNGTYSQALFINSDIVQAVHMLDSLRQSGMSVEQYLAQPDLFGKELSPEAETLLRFFDKNKTSYKRIAATSTAQSMKLR